jgi:hypothetical protein
VDLEYGMLASRLLEQVRRSPSNRTCVIFAIQDSLPSGAMQAHANFIIQKPIRDDVVEATFRAALGLIIREFRRYFRCQVAIPAHLQIDDATDFRCQIVNISEGGAAVATLTVLEPGTPAKLSFTLPDEPVAFVLETEVCWSDNTARAGLQFRSTPTEQRTRLQSWLSRKIERGLPEAMAQRFRREQ